MTCTRYHPVSPLVPVLALMGHLAAASPACAEARSSMRVLSGEAEVLNLPDAMRRVVISDPKIANIRVLQNNQLLIQGLKAGHTTLFVFYPQRRHQRYELTVTLDVNRITNALQRVLDNPTLTVTQADQCLVLTGTFRSEQEHSHARQLVKMHGFPILDRSRANTPTEQLAIHLKVLELSRTAVSNLGLTPGSSSVSETGNGLRQYVFKPWEALFGQAQAGEAPRQTPLEALNARLDLLQRQGEAHLLARPTLVVLNGASARFLAGGEFPIPIQQALGTTTIQFKEFGVKLDVRPCIQDDGRILLTIKPEVSSLDFSSGVKQANFQIPVIKSRRLETQVLLRPAETLLLGGLFNTEHNRLVEQLPWLGDLPILGELFKSRRFQDNQSELAVLATPERLADETAPRVPDTLQRLEQELGHGLRK